MEFIKIGYCISIPILLMFILFNKSKWNRYAVNVLAVSNILLIGNSFFLIWQMMSLYLLGKQFNYSNTSHFSLLSIPFIRLLLIIIIPFVSFFPSCRKNIWVSITFVLLIYWNFPFSTWNTYDLLFKIPGYLCLLFSMYALAWLQNKLPFQTVNS